MMHVGDRENMMNKRERQEKLGVTNLDPGWELLPWSTDPRVLHQA